MATIEDGQGNGFRAGVSPGGRLQVSTCHPVEVATQQVTVTTSGTEIAAANDQRCAFEIANTGTFPITFALSETPATGADFPLAPGATWRLPDGAAYRGAVKGLAVWSSTDPAAKAGMESRGPLGR